MTEDEQRMVWTIGLNDHISGGLDGIMARADRLKKSLAGVFKGITEPADVVDTVLEMVAKRLDALGLSEKEASKIITKITDDFETFSNKGAKASTLLAEWGGVFKSVGASGKEFVDMLAPLEAALDKLYLPTDKAVEVMDALYKRLEEIGVPVNLWKDELDALEKQIDGFVRSGEGANELIQNSTQLFENMAVSGDNLDSLTESINNLTEAEKRQAEAAQEAATAQKKHAEAIEAAKRASAEDFKNNLLKLSRAHKDTAISSRMLSNQFLHLLQRMGLLPPGVSRLVSNLMSLESALTVVGRRSKAMSGLADMFSVRVGYAAKSVNIFTYAITKLAGAVKGFLTACHGAGAVVAAVLAAFVLIYKKFEKDLTAAREEVAKTFDETMRLAEKRGNIIAEMFERESKAAEDATRRIREEAKAYEELANAKENVAKAKSEDAVAGIEADRAKWKRENGDASPEENAVADALFDLQLEQRKQQDLEREQAHEKDLERNEAKRRYKERSNAQQRYEDALQREQDAQDAYDALESSRPNEIDIKTDGAPESMQNFRYKNREEYEEALKKWRKERKAAKNLKERISAERHKAESELPEYSDDVKRQDEAYKLNLEAAAIRRATAKRTQGEAVDERENAYNRAVYAYETSEQKKAYDREAEMERLSHASSTATKERKHAEERLAGSTDDRERAALKFAVKEKQIAEDYAKVRENLERERYQMLSQTNDKLEQERIDAEYDYRQTWAKFLSERESEELAAQKRIHDERVADAQNEYNERMAQLRKEQSAAQSRLQAAQSQVAKAWGWYRNKDSMAAYRNEMDEDMAAQKQYQKDYYSLTHGRRSAQFAEAKELQRLGHYDKLEERMGEWRQKKMLSVDEEATMRVALAKDEEKNAAEYARQTAEAVTRAAESLDAIKAAFEEGEA